MAKTAASRSSLTCWTATARCVLALFMVLSAATSCTRNDGSEKEHAIRLERTATLLKESDDYLQFLREQLVNPADIEYLRESMTRASEFVNEPFPTAPHLCTATCHQYREGRDLWYLDLMWVKREMPPSSISRVHVLARGPRGATSVSVPVSALVTYQGKSTDSYIWDHRLTGHLIPGDTIEYKMEDVPMEVGVASDGNQNVGEVTGRSYNTAILYIGEELVDKGSISVRISDESGTESNEVRLVRLRASNPAITEES